MKVIIDYKEWVNLKAAIEHVANQIEQPNLPIGIKRSSAAQLKALIVQIENKSEG